MKNLIFLLPFYFLCTILSAQVTDFKGFVVTTNSDTLHGILKEDIATRLNNRVKFKADGTSKFKTYTVKELSSFHFSTGKSYHKIIVPITIITNDGATNRKSEAKFLYHLVKGKMNLLMLETGSKKRFFIGEDIRHLVEMPDPVERNTYRGQIIPTDHPLLQSVYTVEVTVLQNNSDAFALIAYLFKDCNKATKFLNENFLFQANKIIKLVKIYNNCFSKKVPNEVLYQNEYMHFSIQPTVVLPLNSNGGLGYGGMLEVMVPSWNKNFSLTLGYIKYPSNIEGFSNVPFYEYNARLNVYLSYNNRVNLYGFFGGTFMKFNDQVEILFISQSGSSIVLRDVIKQRETELYGGGLKLSLSPHHHLKIEIARHKYTSLRFNYGYQF